MPAVFRVSVLILAAILAPQSVSAPPAAIEVRSSALLPAAGTATQRLHTPAPDSTPSPLVSDSSPSAWFTTLIIFLLIGHQLRRKHRLLRPQRFNQRFTV